LQEVSETIPARGWISLKPGEYPFYSMPKSGWIEIQGSGTQNLSGFQYTSDATGVETLFALPVGASKKIVPHVPDADYWITNVTLINPNDAENHVTFHLARAGADRTGDLNIVLEPREKRVVEIGSQFGKRPNDPLYHSILEITGLAPLAGYFSYSVPDGGDKASYPLLDETHLKETLGLPHYPANDGYWWTGVGICNPSISPVTVRIEPYDGDGKLMAESTKTVTLSAGGYDVFGVASLFSGVEGSISLIKFSAQGDSAAAIGGFYLYGNSGNQILSGAVMQ
jgi:hypothetical protein